MNTVETYANDIFVKNQPEEAIKHLLSSYTDSRLDAQAIYAVWVRTRQYIVKQDRYKDPEYEKHIQELAELAEDREDADKLLKLLDSPLRDQHRVQSEKKTFLKDRRTNRLFKAITPILPAFYRFKLPPEIYQWAKEKRVKKYESTQAHQTGNRDRLYISDNDAIAIVDKAREVILDDIGSNRDYYNNVAALQFLSGRRVYEILVSIIWTPASHPFQANVVGIAKKRTLKVDGYETHTIPLLCPYADFDKAMTRVRAYMPFDPDTDDASSITPTRGKYVDRACIRLFGKKYTQTQKRNIYAELAWRKRDVENHFLIGKQSCSKHYWFSKALCHEFNLAVTDIYQTMSIG